MIKKIKVFDIEYEVIEKESWTLDNSKLMSMGLSNSCTGEVWINKDLKKDIKMNTLMHEILHLIADNTGTHQILKNNTEAVITALATGIDNVLKNNSELLKLYTK